MWTVEEKKKRRIWYVAIAILQIVSWVSATSRSLAPHYDDHPHQQGSMTNSNSLLSPTSLNSKQVLKSMGGGVMGNEEEAYKGLGSRPPSCEHRCGGCIPCEAIQVPTTTDHLGVQYANYEPEGWKCKCGASFFNP